MKYIYLFFSFLFFSFLVAQEEEKVVVKDTVAFNERDLFIADYSNQLNIKLEVSNEVKDYYVPIGQNTIELVPNLGIRYALVFDYRFLSISLGIRSQPSKDNKEAKGETDMFEMSLTFLFDKWSHRFTFNRVKGYYVNNGSDFDPVLSQGDRFIQFPNLTTHIFSGTSGYKFNDNYSVKATVSQTEIQLKSAGSFLPTVDYWLYVFNGADKIIDGEGNEIDRMVYKDYTGFNVVFNIGYYYTFIVKKWYFNLSAAPGIGADFYKETTNDIDGDKYSNNQTDFVVSIQGIAGIGYNSDKYHFGIRYINRYTNEFGYDGSTEFQTLKNSFFVFFGYRFKAPKQISAPVDYIEKKVPILKD